MQDKSLILASVRRARSWRRASAIQRYGATAGLVLATFAFWYAISDVPADARFIAFMPAVIASSFVFGREPGYFAAASSVALVLYQFVAPVGSFVPADTTVGALVIFLATSALAAELIEALRETVDRLADANSLLETVIEGAPEPLAVKDGHGRYVRANSRMARLLGTKKTDMLGRLDREFLPQDFAGRLEIADRRTMASGRPDVCEEAIGLGAEPPRCCLFARAPWFGPDGTVLGMITLARDIEPIKQVERELRASDRHKAILLQDINHRVKNSLASVAGLLEISRMKIEDPRAKGAVSSAVRQLVVLARVFDRLHQSKVNDSIPVRTFLEGLCHDLVDSVVGERVGLQAAIEEALLSMDQAISLGLIVNELVTNALKYAFPGDRTGRIAVRFRTVGEGEFCLEVADDGIGRPADAKEGSGTTLVEALARQLGGSVEWSGSGGAVVSIRFPRLALAA